MSDILEIQMQSSGIECFVCGIETEYCWGVPIYNGDIVSNNFPEEMWEHGRGRQAVCEPCYKAHEDGKMPTFDHYYIRPGFIGGDEI